MYIIECVSKLGATRYIRNKPVGNEKLLYSANRKDAFEFNDMAVAQNYRDEALEENNEVFLFRLR